MNTPEQEDIVLIQNILQGNKLSEEIFFTRYKKIIKNYLKNKYSKTNADDIDDYVSIILTKIFYNLNTYKQEKSCVKTWALAIAKHFMIDRWRSNTITILPNIPITFLASSNDTSLNNDYESYNSNISVTISNSLSVSDNCNFTASNAVNFENCNSINYISNQISSKDFMLLNMKYIQGYKYCEIGKEFNLTSDTISNRVNYLKTKLKKDNPEIIYD